MVLKKTVLSSLVVLVALCLTAKGIYKLLYYGNLDLRISKRSLERNNKTAPITVNFPRNYHATGRLFLPHSNIVEPFEIWFTSDYNRSRIDYYYGTDKTFQRADLGKYGVTLKVVPMHTEKDGNYIGCWKLEGHKGWPIIPQPIVPNMTYFKYAGEEVYMGTPATRWEYRYMVFGLLNSHTLLVSKLDTVRPVRYEMKGYDSLMASYYDNYVVEYISFEDWEPDLEKFELPKDQWCYNWSHSLDSHFVSNPMGEFMSYGEDIVEEMYQVYKDHHNKIHDSQHEHVKRKHIFRHNMRYIRSINRQNLAYKLAPNHLVDLTDEEYDGHAGLSDDNNTDHKGGVHLEEHHESYSNMSAVLKTVEVPDELDWREYGAVTPVRGQGICGSCYALGAVGAVEGAYFMKTGQLVELSAQQVIDCSWGSGNHGCRGGWYNKALSWIYMNGVAKAKNYGPYLAQEGTCETLGIKERVKIDAFAFVPKYNNSALKRAIAKYGPACVSINQRPLSLKFYSWGIYDNPECDNSSTRHTVLVVGYGNENGVPYWLVKNSWSSSWGIDGYIKLAWRNNICGVTKNPVVALFKHTTFQFPVKEKIDRVNPLEPSTMGRKVHAKHKPGYHSNVNGSSFLRRKNNPSLTSSPSNRNRTSSGKRKFKENHSAHHDQAKIQRHEIKTLKTSTISISRGNKPSIYSSTGTNKDKGLSAPTHSTAFVQKQSLHTQKVEETIDETVDKTVEMNSSQVKPQTNKDFQYTANKYPDRAAMKSSLPSNTEANELNTAYDVYREGEQNLAHYDTQLDDHEEIMARQNLVDYNTPEPLQNVVWDKTLSGIGQYYYPSYDYNNNYNTYPVEYGAKNGFFEPANERLNREYANENVVEQNYLNSRQWLPARQSDRTRNLNAMEPAPLLNSQESVKLLTVRGKETIETPAKPSTTTTTKEVKKTVNNKSTSTSKKVRHFAGKLQDIYDKLDEVIASGKLKKHRQLKKNHMLWGY